MIATGVCFSITNSYYVSAVAIFFNILLGDGWSPVAIYIIKAAVPTRIHGTTVSIFYFCVTVCGTIATLVVGTLLQSFENDEGKVDS